MSDLVERLEPCPFCGGKAEWHDITEADEIANIGGSCIVCTQCQACGPVQFGEKDTIVEHWNRRAESPELARLRSEVERLTRDVNKYAYERDKAREERQHWSPSMSLYSIWDSYYPGPARKQKEIIAYETALAARPDDCVRLEPCEACGGEGQFYTSRYGGNDPDVWPYEQCPWCRGTGEGWIAVDPVTLDDLEEPIHE